MVDVTLLELNVPESTFNAPFSGGKAKGTEQHAESGGAGSKLAPIVGLLVLVGIALAVRYVRQNGGREAFEKEEALP